MISDKIMRLRPNYSQIDPKFLELALSSSFSQEYLVRRKTGLADAQVNISQTILKSTPIAYPSVPEQRRIVAYLDGMQSKIDALKRHQAKTAAELDALLPAVLERAFRGEL
jgi:type I restriction enzyme S subunit